MDLARAGWDEVQLRARGLVGERVAKVGPPGAMAQELVDGKARVKQRAVSPGELARVRAERLAEALMDAMAEQRPAELQVDLVRV